MSWIEDFGEVELDAIEQPDVSPGWTHTKAYSRSEVEGWVKDLQTIQNLSHTQGMRYEDFERMSESTNPHERALGRTHYVFYESARRGPQAITDPVKLTWDNGRFLIENGRHRIDRAQALGLRTIPARFSVREEDLAAAAPRVHRTGLFAPADRDPPSRLQRHDPTAARQAPATGRSPTPLWERGGATTRLRGERTRD